VSATLLVAFALSVAAQTHGEAPKTETAKIEGKWVIDKYVRRG